MRRTTALVLSALGFMLPGAVVTADDLQAIGKDDAQRFGKILSEAAAKLEKPQVKIDGDADKAVGLHAPEKLGMLLVPQKDLKESEELEEKFKADTGASLAYLFLYHLVPVIDGQPVDGSRLRSVTLTGDNGESHTVHVLLLSVRKIGEDDYRLYAYGHEDKPLIDTQFAEGTGPGDLPIAIEVKDKDEVNHQGKIVLTVFGKYQAGFKTAYKEN